VTENVFNESICTIIIIIIIIIGIGWDYVCTGPMSNPQMIYQWTWSSGWMILTGEARSTRGRTLSQCHSVHHKTHINWPGVQPGPPC
jgi:hypothetical protein